MTKSHSKVGQNTTHPCLYIRNIDDALKVLEAARSNVLPLIRHRLCAQERAQLKSGNVFVWEESSRDCPEGGLVRWTEGRKWSQSRFRRDCFIYKEKLGFERTSFTFVLKVMEAMWSDVMPDVGTI
ncbi:Gti1/Pac2 family-domain-containing protein [Mycena rebaudengoi]|nr:Gti1/Pac2 family-domain-containing protein [Mycena rebaudengoi]